MFDSGISAHDLIAGLKREIDVAIPITNREYVEWLNAAEQLLYTEIIKEQAKVTVPTDETVQVDLANLTMPEGERTIQFEDVCAVFAGCKQLMKTSLIGAQTFEDVYCKNGNKLEYVLSEPSDSITVVYIVKPRLKSVDESDNVSEADNVCVPVEFLDLIKAKLRGEAYKLANEDPIAAKWLNDYNVLLETFKAWIATRKHSLGQ